MASGDTLATFFPEDNEPPASAYATFDTRNAHPVLDFDGSTADEEAVFTGVLPRNYATAGSRHHADPAIAVRPVGPGWYAVG